MADANQTDNGFSPASNNDGKDQMNESRNLTNTIQNPSNNGVLLLDGVAKRLSWNYLAINQIMCLF